MSDTPPFYTQQNGANKFLWVIKTYMDLITKNTPLVPGNGITKLYSAKSGLTTMSDEQICGVAAKATRCGLIPNLQGFVTQCIFRNLYLYANELQLAIHARIIAISDGKITNPESTIRKNPAEARRQYYLPPSWLLTRLDKAVEQDTFTNRISRNVIVHELVDVSADALIVLNQFQVTDGYSTPNATSWGMLLKVVDAIVDRMKRDADYCVTGDSYQQTSLVGLKILWVLGKLLFGDLTMSPYHSELADIDLSGHLNYSDGTLACVPFPSKHTLALFGDDDQTGISMKGRMYLAAVAAATFYRNETAMD